MAQERSFPAATGAREIELKLLAAPADLARLAAHPALEQIHDGTPRDQHQLTTYFDTPALALAAAGVALRLRETDGRAWSQGLKTLGSSAPGDAVAVAVRREWEWPLKGPALDRKLLESAEVNRLLPGGVPAELVPIFQTEIRRTVMLVHPDAHTTVEIAFDRGAVRTASAERPVSEIELELRTGRVGPLFDLALALHHLVPLRLVTESKADAGFHLVTGQPARARQPVPLALAATTTVAEAFRHVVRHALGQLLDNQAGALAALDDPENADTTALRNLRDALRRLRNALALFGPVLASPALEGLVAECRDLAVGLGPAHRWAKVIPLAPEVAKLPVVTGARQATAELARTTITGSAFTRLVLNFSAWLEQERWREQADAAILAEIERPMAELAGPWLDRLHRRVRKAALPHWDGSGSGGDGLKRLRRRVRRLHDALESLRGLYAPSATRPVLSAAGSLRAVLDSINTLLLARTLLAGCVDAETRARFEVGLHQHREALAPALRHLRQLPIFWK